MIKVENKQCSFKGPKNDVITELEIATTIILEEISTLDKLILLHMLTDIINKSIKEKTDE